MVATEPLISEPQSLADVDLEYVLSDDSCRCLGVTSLFQNIFMSHMTESQGNPKESYNFEMERHLSLGNIKVKNWKYFEILNDE